MSVSVKMRERIIENLGIINETAEYSTCQENTQIVFLDGEDIKSQLDVRFLIYDCSGDNIFSYNEYDAILKQESEKSIFTQVMIFDNLDQESSIRIKEYSKLKLAGDKKKLERWFSEKIAVYAGCEDTIEIEVEEDGINYLEYILTDNENLKGYIYNVSYYELKNVLNITGKKLFRENVRIGLSNNKTGKKLKGLFKEYIKIGLFNVFCKDIDNTDDQSEIMELLELDDEIIKITSPEKFWFYHNGITIFSYDIEDVCRRNNRIKLNPNKISIINGAQTLTNFFNAMNEIRYEYSDLIPSITGSSHLDENWFEQSLIKVCKEIKIKTIIIDGPDKYVKKISEGLNTQIPIEEEDILAISNEVFEINQILKENRISIMRDGEVSADNNLSVIEYIKKYLMIIDRPGKSKNLNRNDLKSLLKESIERLKVKNFANQLSMLIDLDNWWKELRKQDLLNTEDNKNTFYKYGKNYFGSYLLHQKEILLDEENLYNLFNQFVNEFSALQNDVTLDDFKKDDFFGKYLEYKNSETSNSMEKRWSEIINKKDFCKYMNQNVDSRYTVSNVISEYLLSKKISLEYFRVIAVTNKKVNEAYPFPSRTFNELYQEIQDGESVKNLEYKDSELCKEINREFSVFVVFWQEGDEEENIENIEIIESFSFRDYSKNAEEVFELTKEAFKQGDERLFLKSSSEKKFHIRTKALNGDDTFEFSNGKQITKRTFWANKSTIEEILTAAIKF